MNSQLKIENPKRRSSSNPEIPAVFNYYAGFSTRFAKTIIESSGLVPVSTILDPWNGSGTTSEMAAMLGHRAIGFDLNPAMAVIARARMLRKREMPSVRPLFDDIRQKSEVAVFKIKKDDPLLLWFAPQTTRFLRCLESSIQELLISSLEYQYLIKRDLAIQVSDLACFFYTALFRTVGLLARPYRSSNPTWIKVARKGHRRITVGISRILSCFRTEVLAMLETLEINGVHTLNEEEYLIDTASSTQLPLETESIDLTLTSPPYCTRIDYARATQPELAVMGVSADSFRELRNKLIGTSTIVKTTPNVSADWGNTCRNFLKNLGDHGSKASKSYYLKNHLQYFDGIHKSIRELARVTKPGGRCILVVQDSYYKEIHNDLPRMLIEMSANYGFKLGRKVDFQHARTMAGINPRIRQYRCETGATESVICLDRI